MADPVEFLQRVPLFAKVPEKELKRLAESFTERSFSNGQELTAEGGGGVGFFVIESGDATVTVDGEARRTLSAGDYFGEIALIDGGLRTATITATSDGKSWGLTSWQFRPLVEENATIAWPMLVSLAQRLREVEATKG